MRHAFADRIKMWGGSYAIIIPHKTAQMMIAEQKADIKDALVRVEVAL